MTSPMPLTITVELLTGSYDAGDADDRRLQEWPPHPARLFCALVASARSTEERDALAWLERQPPPLIRVAADYATNTFTSYVVTNTLSERGGNLTHAGRSNQLRVRPRTQPATSVIRFTWPVSPVDEVESARLDAVCRRVPYLGRSTGMALVAAAVTAASPDESATAPAELAVFEPCDQLDGELMVRVPYQGYLAALDDLFAADRPSWQANRYLYYRRRSDQLEAMTEPVAEPSVYRDVVVFRFRDLRPDGRLSTRFTEALRSHVLRRAGASAPAVLHGHGADGRPHVAFLALPNVASKLDTPPGRATGHLLGLAVAVPDLPKQERRAVLDAVLGLRRRATAADVDTVELDVPRLGQVTVTYEPGLVRPWGATPERWRHGSTSWRSVTPVILDRFPKRREAIEDGVLESVRRVGLPEPVEVKVSVNPLLPGAVPLRPVDLPRKFGPRVFRHVALTFARPVAGPVMVGAGRYLGIGLFAPLRESADTERAASGQQIDATTGEQR